MKEFKIGDRVICKEEYDCNYNIVGKIGTIVVTRKITSYNYGVKFDEYIGGHSLDGRCKNGHGWYVKKRCLELYHDKRVKL